MDEGLRQTLELLKFKPHVESDVMRVFVEDVEFVVVEHPLKGVLMLAAHVGRREAGQLATFFPRTATSQEIGALMWHAFEQLRSERKNAVR